MADSDDLHAQALDIFRQAEEAESHNRTTGLDDIKFAREGIQWPSDIEKQRKDEGRPCYTINKMPAFIRQVVNDARQNKPSIKVHPVDSGADVQTADVINGLIRNIEYTSNADVAYDTATENAVGNGWGYIRVGLDYAYDDSFDQDITINRVSNAFSIYGDPNSQGADSADWDDAFVTNVVSKSAFERKHGKEAAENVQNWSNTDAWQGAAWREGDQVMEAEWWHREKVDKPILLLNNGVVVSRDDFEKNPELLALVQAGVLQVVNERTTKSCVVKQHFVSGADILKTRDWPGRYIPIIPVYGDEFDIQGKRYFRSLIHNAVDAQRMFNYWRTASTELVALAPRVPYVGPVGFADEDENWDTANTKSHPYLQYKGTTAPARQPLDSGTAAGALQEALNASDDMKAIIGLYDASLGARSNETSGRAIMARQREGDVATFHFIDNMARAIRHTGRVIIDLIPYVYNTERVVRVIGEDGKEEAVKINQPTPQKDEEGNEVKDAMGQTVMRIHDLTAGKYDLTVSTGPSFTTRREEAAYSMTEVVRAFPESAPAIVPEIAKNSDWPGAEDIARKLEKMTQPPELPPELMQALDEMKATIGQQQQEIQALKAGNDVKMADIAVKRTEAATGAFAAQTDRINAETDRVNALKPEPVQQAA